MIRLLRPVLILVSAAAAFVATSCTKQGGTIKIGEYASLTGKEATFGQASHRGTLLAVEEINAAGGVLGRKLELITEDDQSKSGEPATVVKKDKEQPKGWLVDFSSRAVLVDFEGGKVTTKYGGSKSVAEDVGTEMLILRPDGRLQVRKSVVDAEDPNRKQLTGIWEACLTKVETRPTPTGGSDPNMFERKP